MARPLVPSVALPAKVAGIVSVPLTNFPCAPSERVHSMFNPQNFPARSNPMGTTQAQGGWYQPPPRGFLALTLGTLRTDHLSGPLHHFQIHFLPLTNSLFFMTFFLSIPPLPHQALPFNKDLKKKNYLKTHGQNEPGSGLDQ